MSRREHRSSDAKRHRSRFDREPSPKRSRRDGKPETERLPTDPENRSDRDQKHHLLQDAVPLEAPPDHDSKVETGTVSKESEEKTSRRLGDTKHSSDPTKIPRSRTYFQHDEHVGQNRRSFGRSTYKERGWWRDTSEYQNNRPDNSTASGNTQRKDEKAKDTRVWRHDGYFEMEANPKPKRPSFREQKIHTDPKKTNKAPMDLMTPNPQDHAVETRRRDEKGHNSSRHYEKRDRAFFGEREFNNKDDVARGKFSSSDKNDVNYRYRGRDDRFSGGLGYSRTGGGGEKWKHDLYNEANKSPSPKNEEDQISKIEALLAS